MLMPALAMTTSSRPVWRFASVTARRTAPQSAASTHSHTPGGVSACAGALRSRLTTWSPAAANRAAVARPMPLDAPVMTTVRTASSLEQDPGAGHLAYRRRFAQVTADDHPFQPAVTAVIAHGEWPPSVHGQVVVDDQEATLLHHHRVPHALQLHHQPAHRCVRFLTVLHEAHERRIDPQVRTVTIAEQHRHRLRRVPH